MANGWGVFYLNGGEVFDVDSVVDLKIGNKAKVSDFPVEQGGFASYNKVNVPNNVKVRLTVGGKARIGAFQAALAAELSAPNLYNVVTPTATYLNVTLEGYDYSQASESGLNLLLVDLALKEIREVSPAYTKVTIPHPKSPTSASKSVNGKVQAQAPPAPPPVTWDNVMSRAKND